MVGPDEGGLYLFRLCFYGGLKVYAALIPSGVETPFHLGMALMNEGVETIFLLNDEEYKIN